MYRDSRPPRHAPRRRNLARRAVLAVLAVAAALVVLGPAGRAQQPPEDVTVLRIATGPTGGTYFPIGGLIANAISNPPGSRPCDRGGSCGVPGLIAAAVSTSGSVVNVQSLKAGTADMALVQADVGFWAWSAEGIYNGGEAVANLRALARLYPESIHLVASAESGIESVADLKGKRVSVGEKGSGTLVEARLILNAHGLKLNDVKPAYIRPGPSADRLANDELDAFFFVGGAPIQTIADLAERDEISLVPIDGQAADKLADVFPYLTHNVIPADTYPNQTRSVATLAVGAVLLTTAEMTDEMAYAITKSLWHPTSMELYRAGHPGGRKLDPSRADDDTGVPLHPGAKRFYDERAKIAAEETAPVAGP
ncbi:TAXI family TRAP transporter solute-binding subunit [Caenispirillum salinarum]|uniref:TAXI family TRAP transporter solute-binding subunit n=1 Tax=Caenispirillum salinarum TaxID=859058 RepID=UPI00384F158B